jgi:imidazolonepropionase-like amidohydrolase
VYPSPGAAPLEDATIVIRDGRIETVSKSKAERVSSILPGAKVIDCTGMTITAGLWNSHVHILPEAFLHSEQKTGTELTSAIQDMLTGWGFTTVFDVGSLLANTNGIRARIATGEVLGPHILTVGEPFFPLNGIPIYVRGYLEMTHISLPDDPTTPAAVERVKREIHDGADGIKIFSGSIQAGSILPMPLERAQAIVAEAHRLKRPVFAHPSNEAGVDIAIRSNADVLAHVA